MPAKGSGPIIPEPSLRFVAWSMVAALLLVLAFLGVRLAQGA
jgi:hypothetical protein